MKYYDWLIFFGLLGLIVFSFDFDEIYSKRPQGPHNWRQTDCASLALNYYQDEDASLITPRTHHLMGKNHDGKAMGEIPVIYYCVSRLYALFGVQEGLFRVFNFMIYAIGLFYLFRLSLAYVEDRFYASIVLLTACSSVIVIFYAYSFLPNAPALGLAFISWYHMYRYFIHGKKRSLTYFIIFASLASLLKITALLSTGIIISLFILERFFKVKYRDKPLFSISRVEGLYLLIPFVLAVGWIFLAQAYQDAHGNYYFSLDWDPIWLLSDDLKQYTWRRLTSDWGWKRDIIYPGIFFMGFLSLCISWLEKNRFWSHVLTLYLLASIVYIIAFFLALKDHDYYLIHLIGFFPLSFIYLTKWLNDKYKKSVAAYIFLAIIIILSLGSVDRRHKDRYENFPYDDMYNTFEDITPFIRDLGIKASDKVIVEGDPSHCISLYLMNNKGWTGKLSKPDRVDKKFEIWRDAGVKYLFVIGEDRTRYTSVAALPKKLLAQRDNVFIYELLPSSE